jgi:hypothetical protein
MANLIISDAIAARLKQIAERENTSIDAVLEMLLNRYTLELNLSHQQAVFTPFGGEDTAQELMNYLNSKKQHQQKIDKEP